LEVAAGDTVIWKNEDIVPHTATVKKVFDSKELPSGKSWSYVAHRRGIYP
jgi:plastocyanin